MFKRKILMRKGKFSGEMMKMKVLMKMSLTKKRNI